MNDFFTEKQVKARKPHRCAECALAIEPGTVYVRIAGATDGRAWSGVNCVECRELYIEAWDVLELGSDGDWPWLGGLADAIPDLLPEAAPDSEFAQHCRAFSARLEAAHRK